MHSLNRQLSNHNRRNNLFVLLLSTFIYFFSFGEILSQGKVSSSLPKSINIISGVPLTLQNISSSTRNSGGWGDVMSNVGMAMEIKRSYPQTKIRLIVTLNDDDVRENVNLVRNLAPAILKRDDGKPLEIKALTKPQICNGVEVYFADVPFALLATDKKNGKPEELELISEKTKHIPTADMAVQYSANDSPISNLIGKGRKLQVFFSEYSEFDKSTGFSSFSGSVPRLKLNAGPLGFGVYNFSQLQSEKNHAKHKDLIQTWLQDLGLSNFDQTSRHQSLELAFAYAGDHELIQDYVAAAERAFKNKPALIVYKGNPGDSIVQKGNHTLIPLGAHSQELAQALIAESTVSPLVTGDGSLSSALATLSDKKSFIYELVPWKETAMSAFFERVFRNATHLLEAAQKRLFPPINNPSKTFRKKRVKLLIEAMVDSAGVNSRLNNFFSSSKHRLNLAENTLNLFQFLPVFESISRHERKNSASYSEHYLEWLARFMKNYDDTIPFEKLINEFNHQANTNKTQLIEKWYALSTLLSLNQTIDPNQIHRLLTETRDFLYHSKNDSWYLAQSEINLMIEQINSSRKQTDLLLSMIMEIPASTKLMEEIISNLNNRNLRFHFSQGLGCSKHYNLSGF